MRQAPWSEVTVLAYVKLKALQVIKNKQIFECSDMVLPLSSNLTFNYNYI